MDKIKSFRDLMVWQHAVDLTVHTYKATDQFPISPTCCSNPQPLTATNQLPTTNNQQL